MYDTIAIFLPSYGRPDRLETCVRSALNTAADKGRLRFSFCVNARDEVTAEKVKALRGLIGDAYVSMHIESTRQPNLSAYYNQLYTESPFTTDHTLVSMVGDDMVFQTAGWDQRLLEEANEMEGACVLYCNDGFIAGHTLAVNLFTTTRMVGATGKPFMCPKFHAEMIDVVWSLVGRFTQTLRYLSDVVIYHDHEIKKPATEWDETKKRLAPIQRMTNNAENMEYSKQYATVCAANAISNGVGTWDTI